MRLEKKLELNIGKKADSVVRFLNGLIKNGEIKAYTISFKERKEELNWEVITRVSKKPSLRKVNSLNEDTYYLLKRGRNSYRFTCENDYQDDDYGCYNPFSSDKVTLEKLIDNVSKTKPIEDENVRNELGGDWRTSDDMVSARLKMNTRLNGSDITSGKTVVEVRPESSWLENAFKDMPYKEEPLDYLIGKVVDYLQTARYRTVKIPGRTYKVPVDD
ncbi:hypothetical protein COV11_01650 [Candidatus Woesearchaeota archaeon CG10_big_fil_rev_8_21_14_0_10_30_7]|nr:MAG: hypothetical protein COV11_01650 [Candidatus Woesearchaeota archaeon CG10_big_fil_rev_8_21_14_0_10_30_7]